MLWLKQINQFFLNSLIILIRHLSIYSITSVLTECGKLVIAAALFFIHKL